MNRKITIIIPNELETKLPLFVFPCDSHQDGVTAFIIENGICLGKDELVSAHSQSCVLAEQGFCVMHYDQENGEETLLVYLPEKISPKQYTWFQKRQTGLSKYKYLFFYNYTKEKTWQLFDQETTKNPILSELMQQLEEKQISSLAKKKVLNK